MDIDDEHRLLGYGVRLIIEHPNINPDLITKELGLTPHHVRRVGEPRRTPKGRPLPGRHEISGWTDAYFVEGERAFSRDVIEILEDLETHADFIRKIDEEGGRIFLVFDFEGERNIGDVIEWRLLKRLADLRIDLSIEVFPKTNRILPSPRIERDADR